MKLSPKVIITLSIAGLVLMTGYKLATHDFSQIETILPSVSVDSSEVEDAHAPALTESGCSDAGGDWDSCGSACRMEGEDAVCIEMCVEYCECHGDDECPANHSCKEFVEEVGVCKPF